MRRWIRVSRRDLCPHRVRFERSERTDRHDSERRAELRCDGNDHHGADSLAIGAADLFSDHAVAVRSADELAQQRGAHDGAKQCADAAAADESTDERPDRRSVAGAQHGADGIVASSLECAYRSTDASRRIVVSICGTDEPNARTYELANTHSNRGTDHDAADERADERTHGVSERESIGVANYDAEPSTVTRSDRCADCRSDVRRMRLRSLHDTVRQCGDRLRNECERNAHRHGRRGAQERGHDSRCANHVDVGVLRRGRANAHGERGASRRRQRRALRVRLVEHGDGGVDNDDGRRERTPVPPLW